MAFPEILMRSPRRAMLSVGSGEPGYLFVAPHGKQVWRILRVNRQSGKAGRPLFLMGSVGVNVGERGREHSIGYAFIMSPFRCRPSFRSEPSRILPTQGPQVLIVDQQLRETRAPTLGLFGTG